MVQSLKRIFVILICVTGSMLGASLYVDSIKAETSSNIPNEVIIKQPQSDNNQATDWLSDQLEILKSELALAEQELSKSKQEKSSQSSDVILSKIESLNAQLLSIQTELDKTTKTVELFDDAKKGNRLLDAVPELFTSPVFESLKITEGTLLRKQAALKQRYGTNHPEMITIQAEFNAFQKTLDDEIDIFAQNLDNQMTIQSSQIDNLSQQIEVLRAIYIKNEQKDAVMTALKDKVHNMRMQLNNFTATHMFLKDNAGKTERITIPSIISEPRAVSDSNQKLLLLLSGLTGLFIVIFILMLFERVGGKVKSSDDLEKISGASIYGSLPKVKFKKDETPSSYLLSHTSQVLAEKLRSLLVTLQLRDPHTKDRGRIVTITSTKAGEGKTTTAIWLATTAAQNGKNVIIIDTDMRNPSLHKAYNIGSARGLVDYLSDRLPLDDVIYRNHISGVHIMTSKAIPTHALTLLSDERMETLLRRVSDMYDLVILDCSAASDYSDAYIMANQSDKIFYIVEDKIVKSEDLKKNIDQFLAMKGAKLSFILNKI